MNYRDIERAEKARDRLEEAYKDLGNIQSNDMTEAFRSTGKALMAVEAWIAENKRMAYKVEVQAVVSVPVYVWAEDEAKACELAREMVEAKLSAQPLDIDDIDTDVYECFEAEDLEGDACDIQQQEDES